MAAVHTAAGADLPLIGHSQGAGRERESVCVGVCGCMGVWVCLAHTTQSHTSCTSRDIDRSTKRGRGFNLKSLREEGKSLHMKEWLLCIIRDISTWSHSCKFIKIHSTQSVGYDFIHSPSVIALSCSAVVDPEPIAGTPAIKQKYTSLLQYIKKKLEVWKETRVCTDSEEKRQ